MVSDIISKATHMAKPNYQYEKRQRELQKKQKKEEKAQRKAHAEPAAQEPPPLPRRTNLSPDEATPTLNAIQTSPS